MPIQGVTPTFAFSKELQRLGNPTFAIPLEIFIFKLKGIDYDILEIERV